MSVFIIVAGICMTLLVPAAGIMGITLTKDDRGAVEVMALICLGLLALGLLALGIAGLTDG